LVAPDDAELLGCQGFNGPFDTVTVVHGPMRAAGWDRNRAKGNLTGRQVARYRRPHADADAVLDHRLARAEVSRLATAENTELRGRDWFELPICSLCRVHGNMRAIGWDSNGANANLTGRQVSG
jgi:hypothetical protein